MLSPLRQAAACYKGNWSLASTPFHEVTDVPPSTTHTPEGPPAHRPISILEREMPPEPEGEEEDDEVRLSWAGAGADAK